MRVQLHPSFLRGAASVLSWLVALTAISYAWQGYHKHHWWTRDYFLTLLIPFTIMPAFICFMAVPSRLEFSDTDLIIQFLFRRPRTIPWDDLAYYGWLEGVYGLQFRGAGMLDILPQALPRREWQMFKSFLFTTFPERKASGFIGARFFQWPWKKKKT
jgi:hypothetical protein